MLKKIWGYPKVKAIIFLILAVILGLGLSSYSPTDNAWNTSSGEAYHNWLGPVGAWSADILLQLMGQAAFLVPLAFFIFAVLYIVSAYFFIPPEECIFFPLSSSQSNMPIISYL